VALQFAGEMTVRDTSDAGAISIRRPVEDGGGSIVDTIVTQDAHSFNGNQAQIDGHLHRVLCGADRAS
jgi:hypothetical protein